MLSRCYSDKYQNNEPTYRGVIVDDEWKLFSNFRHWCDQNYRCGFDLDKDLLGDGSSYSKDVCVFIPRQINNFLNKKSMEQRGLPRGVRLNHAGRYTAQCNNADGKAVYLGSYGSPSEAFYLGYKPFKENVAEELASRWKGMVDDKVVVALLNFKVGSEE